MKRKNLIHPISPEIYTDSKVLILGTFPSPKSREFGFFYGHPRNRFWKVLSTILSQETPRTNEEKKEFLKRNHIALWDVLKSCTIEGASDSSIKDPVPNDILAAIQGTDIRAIFTTGQKAFQLYNRFNPKQSEIPVISLPSTSPANAAMSLKTLEEKYKVILNYL